MHAGLVKILTRYLGKILSRIFARDSTNVHTHFLYSEHTIYRFVVVTTLHTNSAKVAFELFLCLDSRVLFCFGYLTHKILVMPVLKVKVDGIPL